jgi:hypothetical protein
LSEARDFVARSREYALKTREFDPAARAPALESRLHGVRTRKSASKPRASITRTRAQGAKTRERAANARAQAFVGTGTLVPHRGSGPCIPEGCAKVAGGGSAPLVRRPHFSLPLLSSLATPAGWAKLAYPAGVRKKKKRECKAPAYQGCRATPGNLRPSLRDEELSAKNAVDSAAHTSADGGSYMDRHESTLRSAGALFSLRETLAGAVVWGMGSVCCGD